MTHLTAVGSVDASLAWNLSVLGMFNNESCNVSAGLPGPGPRDDFLCLSPSSLFRQAASASHKADLMLLQWIFFFFSLAQT